MRVEEIMSTHLKTCRSEDSLQAAGQSMWDHDIGILPVVAADGRLTSVITDRDIAMAASIRGKPLHEIRVSEAMSKRLVTVLPSDDLHLAEERMQAEQVHRIPVVDSAGFLTGIITINDLAHHLRSRKLANGVTPEEVCGNGRRDQRPSGSRQQIADQHLTSVILAVSLAGPGGVALHEGIGSQFASAAPQPAPESHAMTPTTELSLLAYPATRAREGDGALSGVDRPAAICHG